MVLKQLFLRYNLWTAPDFEHFCKNSFSLLLSFPVFFPPFFFQLFDHEGEAELILKNTGKVGFEFTIVDPQREDEADKEGGWQRKVDEEAEQQPDARPPKYYKQSERGQEVRPGQPTFIPTRVSSSISCFRFNRVLYHFTSFCVIVLLCVSGLCWSWYGALSASAVPAGCPWGVQEAASAKGGFLATPRHHSDWRGSVPKDQPQLAEELVYA